MQNLKLKMEEEKKEEHGHHGHEQHNSEHHKRKFKLNPENVFLILAVALLIILLANIFLTFELNMGIRKNSEMLKEKLRPAKVQLAVIKNSKCTDCFDISPIVGYIKTQKVNLTNEKTSEFGSAEAKRLISLHKIEKLPAVIVTGEIDKANIAGLDKKDNALILEKVNPPYTNAINGNIVGMVTLYKLYDPN